MNERTGNKGNYKINSHAAAAAAHICHRDPLSSRKVPKTVFHVDALLTLSGFADRLNTAAS